VRSQARGRSIPSNTCAIEDYEWDYDQVGNQDYQAPQPVIPPSTEQTPRDRSADPPHLRDIIGEPHELPLPAAQANVGHDPVDQISRSLGAATLSTSNYGLYSGNYSGSYSGNAHFVFCFKAIQLDCYEMLI
jgi:hypothetical protein